MRKAKPWRPPRFYQIDRKTVPTAYIRSEVMLTEQQWLDLEVIAENTGRDPRAMLSEAAKQWLIREIIKTFGSE